MTSSRLRPLLSGVVLRSQSDARLAQLAGDGHQLAFTTIFERYQRELEAHAARVVRPGRAEDVVQHAMLNAWSAMLCGEAVQEPRAWLHRIVHNVALNTVARRGYDDSEIPQTTASPMLTADIVERRLSAAEALAAVAALPEAQRRALTLTAFHGRSGADAAAQMGVSESAVRQLVYRARHGMRSAVSAVTPLPVLVSALQGAGASGAATVGGASALSGSAAKTAVVLAVATSGVGATTLVSHNNDRHARTPHARTTATTPNPLVALAPTGVDVPPKRGTHSSARPSQHRHSGSSQARHDSPAARRNRGRNDSSTSGQTTGNALQRPAGTQSSSGENAGEHGPTPSNRYDDSTAPAALSASAGDDDLGALTTTPTSPRPNEPDASTSPDIDDGTPPQPTPN
jgi:RNA polymerase sigma factor (sigma-70 family)